MRKKFYTKLFMAFAFTLCCVFVPGNQARADIAPPPDFPPILPLVPYTNENAVAAPYIELFFTIIIAFILTVIIEFPITYLLGLKTKKAILGVVGVNLLTLPIFYIMNFWTQGRITEGSNLFLIEFIIMVVESCLLCLYLRDIPKKTIFLALFLANIASACLGLWVWDLIFGF